MGLSRGGARLEFAFFDRGPLRSFGQWPYALLTVIPIDPPRSRDMAKGLDKKKEQKKKPAKTLKEKRDAKNEKMAGKGFTPS